VPTTDRDESKNLQQFKPSKYIKVDVVAIIVACIAAAGTIWQGWVVSDTEKNQLRAYIGIVPGGIDNFGDGQRQTFNFIEKNYGQTPAYDVFNLAVLPYMIQEGGQLRPTPTERPPNIRSSNRFPNEGKSPTQCRDPNSKKGKRSYQLWQWV
jgi:hypothetical protein